MPAHPGLPAFSNSFQRETKTRTTTASQIRKNTPPNSAPSTPDPPLPGFVSSWKAAASSIIPIDHLFPEPVVGRGWQMVGAVQRTYKSVNALGAAVEMRPCPRPLRGGGGRPGPAGLERIARAHDAHPRRRERAQGFVG